MAAGAHRTAAAGLVCARCIESAAAATPSEHRPPGWVWPTTVTNSSQLPEGRAGAGRASRRADAQRQEWGDIISREILSLLPCVLGRSLPPHRTCLLLRCQRSTSRWLPFIELELPFELPFPWQCVATPIAITHRLCPCACTCRGRSRICARRRTTRAAWSRFRPGRPGGTIIVRAAAHTRAVLLLMGCALARAVAHALAHVLAETASVPAAHAASSGVSWWSRPPHSNSPPAPVSRGCRSTTSPTRQAPQPLFASGCDTQPCSLWRQSVLGAATMLLLPGLSSFSSQELILFSSSSHPLFVRVFSSLRLRQTALCLRAPALPPQVRCTQETVGRICTNPSQTPQVHTAQRRS